MKQTIKFFTFLIFLMVSIIFICSSFTLALVNSYSGNISNSGDSITSENNANNNYGNQTTINIYSYPNYDTYIYSLINLSSVYIGSYSDVEYCNYAVTSNYHYNNFSSYYCDNSFNEISLKWNNQNSIINNCSINPFLNVNSSTVTINNYFCLNITNIINSDNDKIFTIKQKYNIDNSTQELYTNFNSKENINYKPYISYKYSIIENETNITNIFYYNDFTYNNLFNNCDNVSFIPISDFCNTPQLCAQFPYSNYSCTENLYSIFISAKNGYFEIPYLNNINTTIYKNITFNMRARLINTNPYNNSGYYQNYIMPFSYDYIGNNPKSYKGILVNDEISGNISFLSSVDSEPSNYGVLYKETYYSNLFLNDYHNFSIFIDGTANTQSLYIDGNFIFSSSLSLNNNELNKIQFYTKEITNNPNSYLNMEIDKIIIMENKHINNFDYFNNLSQEVYINTPECSETNCLFSDKFNVNTLQNGWIRNTNVTIVNNSQLFFNPSTLTNPIIYHTFFNNDVYNSVYYYLTFKLNYFDLPQSMNLSLNQNNGYIYSTDLICDNSNLSVYNLKMYVYGNVNNPLETDFYVFTNNNNFINPIGTYTVNNGDTVVFRFLYSKVTQKFLISEQSSSYPLFSINRLYDFGNILMDAHDFQNECDKFSGVVLQRADYNSNLTIYDIGIDNVLIQGNQPANTEINQYPFVYENQTTLNESLIKTDVGETLQNIAFSIGFKTTATKILFWFMIMLLLIFLVLVKGNDLGSIGKTVLISFIIILGIILGWYLGFIPTVILVFLIFCIAVLGAILIQKLISGGSG